jgi:hypothetical protein
MQQAIEQAHAELVKSPGSAEQIAQKFRLSYHQVQNFGGRGESLPEIGSSVQLESALAGLRAGQVSEPVQVSPDKMAIAAVTQVTPPRPAQLAEVANQIREQLISQRVNQLIEQRTKEAADKLRAANGDLEAAARQIGTDVRTTDFFGVETPAMCFSRRFWRNSRRTWGNWPQNVRNSCYR